MKIEYNIEELLKIVDVQLQQEQREYNKKLKEWGDKNAEINTYNDERLSEAHEILSNTTAEGLLTPYVIREKKTKKVRGWIFSRDVSWEEVTIDVDRFTEDYPVFTGRVERYRGVVSGSDITHPVYDLLWLDHYCYSTQRLSWEGKVEDYPKIFLLGVKLTPIRHHHIPTGRLNTLKQLHTKLSQLKKMSDSSLTGSVVMLEDSEIELLFK